jgi:hypothetical protein
MRNFAGGSGRARLSINWPRLSIGKNYSQITFIKAAINVLFRCYEEITGKSTHRGPWDYRLTGG